MGYGVAGAGALLVREAAETEYVSAETSNNETRVSAETSESDHAIERSARAETSAAEIAGAVAEIAGAVAGVANAGAGVEDAAEDEPDAAEAESDAAEAESDAAKRVADAAEIEPDAAGFEPDAAGFEPDAADAEPDAWADPDALEDLGDRIATLAAHIHAADYRLLVMIEEFDRRKGWEPGGHRSCAEWLHFRTGMDMNTAREKVRTARALVDLPETSAAMARGELSFAKVRAITRVASPQSEAELVEFSRNATVAETERFARAWRKMDRLDEEALERERHRSRRLSIRPENEGMYEIRGLLEPEVGALVMRAVEMAADALYRKTARSQELKATQRWADAIGLLAERAMAVGFGGTDVSAETCGEDEDGADVCATGGTTEEPHGVSAETSTCACTHAPISGSRAERYQVMLHVDTGTLTEGGEPGRSHLEDGTRVSAETSRRLTCDGSIVQIRRGPDGSVLDVGRRTRSIPPAIRRALEVRDGGCRFPGCGLRFTSGHHIIHWVDGGPTSLKNLVLLCRFHHRLIHHEGFRMEWDNLVDRPAFYDPRNRRIPEWPAPENLPGDPTEALVRAHMEAGIDPHALTASSRWKSQPDIPWVDYVRVLEALDRAEEEKGAAGV